MSARGAELLLILVLIGINGFFAAAEIALISARRAVLKQRIEEGSRGAAAALKLTEDPSRMLASTQIGITVVGFMATAIATVTLEAPLGAWFAKVGPTWLAKISGPLALLIVTLTISYFTLVLGELMPKRLGLQRAEGIASAVGRPVTGMANFLSPVVWVLARSADLAGRPFGVVPGRGRPGVSEEEIKLLVTEQGTLLDEEKRMITEIFDIGDTVAREVMVPRVDMVSVEDTQTISDAFSVLQGTGYSRLPVYHEDRDRIVGIVLLKEVVGPIAAGRGDECVTSHMRAATFVPETKPILSLLNEMQRVRNHMVIIVDEYGGTAGLVSIEDIVEEIIGDIADEFDPNLQQITETEPGEEWVVEGSLPISDALTAGFPVTESDEYDTVAGWVLAELGHIPSLGEELRVDGYEFRVQQMRRRRISRLRVRRLDRGEQSEVDNVTM